jgi:hypothetical protein
MRKNRLLSIVLIVLGLVVFSCKREESTVPKKPIDTIISIEEAKRWFAQQPISKTTPTAKEPIIANPKGYSTTNPQWRLATIRSFSDGRTYVQIPLKFKNSFKRYGYVQQKNYKKAGEKQPLQELPLPQLIIYKDEEGDVTYQVMELLPDQKYYQQQRGIIRKENFSGRLLLYNWAGELIKGLDYNNGVKLSKIVNPEKGGRTAGCYYKIVSTTYYFNNVCGPSYGNSGMIYYYSATITVADGDFMSYPDNLPYDPSWICSGWSVSSTRIDQQYVCEEDPDNGGSGGGDPNPEPNPNSITDDLHFYPCLNDVLDVINGKDLYNTISLDILQGVFNCDDELTIHFSPSTSLPEGVDGLTQITQNYNFVANVDLNVNVLTHSSREYIAAVMLHEVVHGYFDYLYRVDKQKAKTLFPIFYPLLETEQGQHHVMAENYVSQIKDALLETFPYLSPEVANAIAWGGLQNTWAWNINASIPGWHEQIYNLNQNERDVRKGKSRGTKCD